MSAGKLRALGLLTAPTRSRRGVETAATGDPTSPQGLLQRCDAGALVGGLSVAMDLRPDELFGPLTHQLGGLAVKLKVLEVRGDRPVELTVTLGPSPQTWELDDLAGLIDRLNERFAAQRSVKVAAVLGEWEDLLQLWCLPKSALAKLLEAPFFSPSNLASLRAIAEQRG